MKWYWGRFSSRSFCFLLPQPFHHRLHTHMRLNTNQKDKRTKSSNKSSVFPPEIENLWTEKYIHLFLVFKGLVLVANNTRCSSLFSEFLSIKWCVCIETNRIRRGTANQTRYNSVGNTDNRSALEPSCLTGTLNQNLQLTI